MSRIISNFHFWQFCFHCQERSVYAQTLIELQGLQHILMILYFTTNPSDRSENGFVQIQSLNEISKGLIRTHACSFLPYTARYRFLEDF